MIYFVIIAMILLLNLIFNGEMHVSFKPYFICHTCACVSAIMYELGNKSKNYEWSTIS